MFHGPKGKGGLEVQNKPEKRKGFTEFFLLVRREAEQMGVDVNELFVDRLGGNANPGCNTCNKIKLVRTTLKRN